MNTEGIREIGERLRGAQEAVEKQVAGISEARFNKTRGEGEWAPAEVVAHVCESPRLAAAHLKRLATEDNATIGRTPEDQQARLQEIADHVRDSREVALGRLIQTNTEVSRTVAGLSDGQLERKGLHRQWGDVTVRFALNKLVSHYEEHARQLASMQGD